MPAKILNAKNLADEAHNLIHPEKQLLATRQKAIEAINIIRRLMHPGLKESEAIQLAKEIFVTHGSQTHWHKPVIRFGKNTLLTFHQKPATDPTLQENDIYFFDFGPVFDDIEADIGNTFIFGIQPDYADCQQAVRHLFQITKIYWLQTQASGKELYNWAKIKTEEMGYKLYLDVTGHRLSDFPHQAYTKTRLDQFNNFPSPYLWILEFHIYNPDLQIGAFYEDILCPEIEFMI